MKIIRALWSKPKEVVSVEWFWTHGLKKGSMPFSSSDLQKRWAVRILIGSRGLLAKRGGQFLTVGTSTGC